MSLLYQSMTGFTMLVQTLLAVVKGSFHISTQQICEQQGMNEERGKEKRENPLPWQDIICSGFY